MSVSELILLCLLIGKKIVVWFKCLLPSAALNALTDCVNILDGSVGISPGKSIFQTRTTPGEGGVGGCRSLILSGLASPNISKKDICVS